MPVAIVTNYTWMTLKCISPALTFSWKSSSMYSTAHLKVSTHISLKPKTELIIFLLQTLMFLQFSLPYWWTPPYSQLHIPDIESHSLHLCLFHFPYPDPLDFTSYLFPIFIHFSLYLTTTLVTKSFLTGFPTSNFASLQSIIWAVANYSLILPCLHFLMTFHVL